MTLLHDVEQRFGVLPNFFRIAADTPGLTEKLSEFARYGYLDNPLPALFKERLYVLLSRYCEVRYCLARHAAFLLGHGRIAGAPDCAPRPFGEVMRLLRAPLYSGRELRARIDECLSFEAPLADLPGPDEGCEAALFACATHVFLQTPDAPDCLAALKRALGPQRLQHLLLLLSFIRSAHFWTTVHTELEFDEDVRLLLASNEELRAAILGEAPADAGDLRQRMLLQELADSQTLHDISNEMIGEQDEQALYERIIDAAARLMHSPFASMQVLDPGSGGSELRLLGHRGFSARAARLWQRVGADSPSSCGAALRSLKRTIIADTEQCESVAGTQQSARIEAGKIRLRMGEAERLRAIAHVQFAVAERHLASKAQRAGHRVGEPDGPGVAGKRSVAAGQVRVQLHIGLECSLAQLRRAVAAIQRLQAQGPAESWALRSDAEIPVQRRSGKSASAEGQAWCRRGQNALEAAAQVALAFGLDADGAEIRFDQPAAVADSQRKVGKLERLRRLLRLEDQRI